MLAACGSDSGSSAAPPATPWSSPSPDASAAPVDTSSAATTPGDTASGNTAPPNASAPDALQFTAPLVGGGSLDFTQYAGTTVALWFWAPT